MVKGEIGCYHKRGVYFFSGGKRGGTEIVGVLVVCAFSLFFLSFFYFLPSEAGGDVNSFKTAMIHGCIPNFAFRKKLFACIVR